MVLGGRAGGSLTKAEPRRAVEADGSTSGALQGVTDDEAAAALVRAPRGALSSVVTPERVGLVDARAPLTSVLEVALRPRRDDFVDDFDARPPRDNPAGGVDARICPAPRSGTTASP